MPFKEVSVMDQRRALGEAVARTGATVTTAAAQAGVSRTTAYRWLARATAGGDDFAEQSRRPRSSPGQTPVAMEQAVLALRQAHSTWGALKLRAALLQTDPERPWPAASTITALLRRAGLITPEASRARQAFRRFEAPAPNELWQMDFKGGFALPDSPGGRCYPLTVLDDHSRFLIGLNACADQCTVTVQTVLSALFAAVGLPRRLLVDNGPPWGDTFAQPHTQLTVWLLKLGVEVSHGRPYHPQTRGKIERLHRTLGEEMRWQEPFPSLARSQLWFDAFRQEYNHERPHGALGQRPPVTRFAPSPRPLPATLPDLEPPSAAVVRRVFLPGRVSYANRQLLIGRAFVGERVGLVAEEDHRLGVWFGLHRVGHVDLAEAKPKLHARQPLLS